MSKVKIERFSILVLRAANLTQTGLNWAETLSKVKATAHWAFGANIPLSR